MSDIKRACAQSQESVEKIFRRFPAAQFVIMKPMPAKTPAWRGWNRKRPPCATVIDALSNGNGIAVVPASIGCAVIDIDAGNPELLQQARPPLCLLETKRGAHAFYAAGKSPPANKIGKVIKFPGGEIKADVICGATPQTRRYVVIHTAAALSLLAAALSSGNPPPPFPHDLLELSPAAKRYNDDPVRIQRHIYQPPNQPPRRIDLTQVYPGGYEGKAQTGRNENLFSVCCRWSQAGVAMHRAGKLKTADDLLHAAVLWNAEMPVPLSLAEVEKTAASAWSYLELVSGGKGLPFYTHDEVSQRRRQSLAVAARNAKRKADVCAVYELDAQGKKPREIAAKTGVPRRTVYRWLEKPVRAQKKPRKPRG